MGNLMDYLTEYADICFQHHPFSAVDALVLCQLTYPKMDHIVPEDAFVHWEDILQHPDRESLFTDRIFGEMYREFFGKVAVSRRYAGIEAGLFEERFSEEEEYQFAAVTFRMGKESEKTDRYFVAFRGTDEKLVGWKEDFNIGHLGVVPSQLLAVDYLNRVPGSGSVFTGGHSKGGSQAVYAAAKADSAIRERITGIYSFDGMGLGNEFYDSPDFARIRHKTIKVIPEESIIGTLFERRENCLVVRSRGKGFRQHDFMNWQVRDGHFLYRERLKGKAVRLANGLNNRMDSLTIEERKWFVELLYGLVLSCRPENIYNMGDEKRKKAATLLESLNDMGKQERMELKRIGRKLLRTEEKKIK